VIEEVVQFDTNIDDMDPRLWPRVIDQLLAAGAVDAWITPITMKKGRPAFTLSALTQDENANGVRAAIFAETTTIGVREQRIQRHVLDRAQSQVQVQGQSISVKIASLDDQVVNRSVEWDDLVAAADALGLSAKDVLAAAVAQVDAQA
jgi:uncharacterized protein (DUF111 family)